MDYQAFYDDLVSWIHQANQMATKNGMATEQFWLWVSESCGTLCTKYGENPLVNKQMEMLVEWIEEVESKTQTRQPV